MSANRKRLLLPETLHEAGWVIARGRDDVESVPYPNEMPAADFRARLAPSHGVALGVRPFGEADLERAPVLAVVGRIGVGYDAVEVPALTRRGIPLMTTGIANSTSVAEQAVFFVLALAKRVAAQDALVKQGRWDERFSGLPSEIAGKTALVVGFGRIGTRAAARLRAFEMRVLVFDPFVDAGAIRAAGFEPAADLDAALAAADVVTIHCPRNPQTIGLFDAARLGRMKRGAGLVNTARGGIVDEAALHAALASGHLSGAGLDVFAEEPVPTDHPLLALPNVITAPHVAGVTHEAAAAMARSTVENLLSVLDGAPRRANAVNPEVWS
jgi:D-3-phosphoglycerate dehydrogenase